MRQLKKLNMRLKLAIVEDDDGIDDAIGDQIETAEVLTDAPTEVIDHIKLNDDTDFNTAESLEIIKTYQSIKDYLIEANQSLSKLYYNNNMFGTDKNDLYSAFLVKKMKRLDICHPCLLDPLQTDEDVINAILK